VSLRMWWGAVTAVNLLVQLQSVWVWH
jgi:hypothetical protein